MAAARENEVTSETETSEKPVREQLKKASISKTVGASSDIASQESTTDTTHREENGNGAEATESRGRPHKKRSFEDLENGHTAEDNTSETTRQHTRKRSRDSTVEEAELNNGQRKSGERSRNDEQSETQSNGQPKAPPAQRPRTPEHTGEKRSESAVEAMASPKTKRSRLHASAEAGKEPDSDVNVETLDKATESAGEDNASTKVPSTSGFANTSASSPFASIGGPKSPPAQTSGSTFAASGFTALSGSSTSGFGSLSKSSGGPGAGGGFASVTKSPPFAGATTIGEKKTADSKPLSGNTFGGALGQQSVFSASGTSTGGFGSGSSGFGGFGQSSGFGGGAAGFSTLGGGGAGLSTFASGKPTATFASSSSSKPSKTFGAPPADEAEGDESAETEDDSGFKSPLSQESDKQDERFYAQELETGEEDEVTEYSCRSKLYNFATLAEGKKEWKERGLGVVRLNVRKAAPGEDDSKPRARLLMRADGSHRVILNTQVRKDIKFGTPEGEAPTGGYIYFMGAVDGKVGLELLQLKIRQQFASELYEKIKELQAAM